MHLVKLISGTFLSRLFQAGVNFLLALLLARWLGAAGKGLASLLVLNISLIVLIQNIAGGGALIYLVPKLGWKPLRKVVYLWAIFSAILVALLIHFFSNSVVSVYLLILLGILVNLSTIQQHLLLAKNEVGKANKQLIILSGILLLSVCLVYLSELQLDMNFYAACIGLAYLAGLVYGAFSSRKLFQAETQQVQTSSIQELFKKGIFSQTANTFQLFNYRLSYYFIEQVLTISSLGVYSIVMNLADLAWLPSRALATVLHSRVANEASEVKQKQDLRSFTIMSLGLTALAALVIAFLPDSFYQWVFGEEFQDIQVLVWYIIPGIIALGVSNMLVHYYNGIGLHHLNTLSSGIGLMSTVVGLIIFIPLLGLAGAALTASISYSLSALFLTIVWFSKK